VAKEIELAPKLENLGARMVREVATATNDDTGDGTTTATVLAQAIFAEGLRLVGGRRRHRRQARYRRGGGGDDPAAQGAVPGGGGRKTCGASQPSAPTGTSRSATSSPTRWRR
jgi:hypothetical protein